MTAHNHSLRNATLVAALLAGTLGAGAQERFKSPDDAVAALVAAARSDNSRDLMKILGTPGRKRKIHAREMQERAAAAQAGASALAEPDAGGHAPSAAAGPAIPSVREEA